VNVSELYDLTKWVNEEIEGKKIPEKINALQKRIQQNSQNRPEPFEQQKDDLLEALESVSLELLTLDQLEFLDNMGLSKNVGASGVKLIEDILYKNSLDIATAAEKIRILSQEVAHGIQKSNQIRQGLSGCVFEEDYESKSEVLIRVCFKGA